MGKVLTHGTFQLHPISLYKDKLGIGLQEVQEPKLKWIDAAITAKPSASL